jgi:hypothetical protein
MNTIDLKHDVGPSVRVLDTAELDAVAGGLTGLTWARHGAMIGARHGAIAGGANGAFFGALIGAAYYTHYYYSHK